jgi:hypothetical protein
MTTIAWDGRILASESRETLDNEIVNDKRKKLFQLENSIKYYDDEIIAYGLAGSISDFILIKEYIISSIFPSVDKIDHNCNGIFIGKKLVYLLESGNGLLIEYPFKSKLAIGSGHTYAIMAMNLGLDSCAAIKETIKFDCKSGGKIQSIRIK